MLLSPELLTPTGPPPQAVLDQRWLWNVMLFLLSATFMLRLIGLDIAGALLSGLMLSFGVIMTRDGMQEMAKYALVYAVLCGLNFFFDILPLITELGGRVSRTAEPGPAVTDPNGFRQTTVTLTTKITPFFDKSMGLIYNVQSMAMVLSPICMALGVYLSITAHNEIQRHTPPFFGDDLEDFGRPFPQAVPGGIGGLATRRAGAPTGRYQGTTSTSPGPSSAARDTFERFQGTAHKLSDD